MAERQELVIVGGGPAGLSTALHLLEESPGLAERTLILERDHLDSTRDIAPLSIATDAVVIDSTGRTADDIVSQIASLYGERCGRG